MKSLAGIFGLQGVRVSLDHTLSLRVIRTVAFRSFVYANTKICFYLFLDILLDFLTLPLAVDIGRHISKNLFTFILLRSAVVLKMVLFTLATVIVMYEHLKKRDE